MRKWKVVVGASIACFCIAAIAVPAIFGVAGGIRLTIEPEYTVVPPGSYKTIDYTIRVYNYQDTADWFDFTVDKGDCDHWFSWDTNQKFVPADGRGEVVLTVIVSNPTSDCKFKVKTVSRSDVRLWTYREAQICTHPPTPPPSPPPPNTPPTCLDLMPDLSEPQIIMTEGGTKEIKWTVFADDPDDDTLFYSFIVDGPGGTEIGNWTTSNEWIWVANESDIGNSTIYADVRDGYHATGSTTPDYDDRCEYSNYQIIENQPPCCACLIPDPSEPQLNGTQINWTACAIDPEGDRDQLLYKFWVNNSSGWNIKRVWNTSNTWIWTPADPGYYDIKVGIRDSYFSISSYPNHEDVNATYWNYTIT